MNYKTKLNISNLKKIYEEYEPYVFIVFFFWSILDVIIIRYMSESIIIRIIFRIIEILLLLLSARWFFKRNKLASV